MAESRRASVDIFLKAAGYLDCAVTHVLPQIPTEIRFASQVLFSFANMLLLAKLANMLTVVAILTSFFLILTWSYILTSFCRRALPVDLVEEVLQALCQQALGQVLLDT